MALSVYRAASTGGLEHVRYVVGSPTPPAIADFDGDGAVDIIVDAISLIRGKGDGTLFASRLAVLDNNGASVIAVGPLTVIGPDASSFSAQQYCPQQVTPGNFCQIGVDFHPVSLGPKTATLAIATSDGPLAIALSGNGVNAAPVASADTHSATEDTTLTVSAPGVRGNDIDANGDPLTVTLVSNGSHGAVTLDANGGFVYTPAADFNGSDSFTYTRQRRHGDLERRHRVDCRRRRQRSAGGHQRHACRHCWNGWRVASWPPPTSTARR